MKSFHEHYMPSNEVLRPVMDTFLKMDISLIAPQHGSIIAERIKEHIRELRDLQCGVFLNLIKKELLESGDYTELCNIVLKRCEVVFGKAEVCDTFSNSEFSIEEDGQCAFNARGREELWERFFQLIYSRKGSRWLTVLEPLLQVLVKEYDAPCPSVFKSTIFQ